MPVEVRKLKRLWLALAVLVLVTVGALVAGVVPDAIAWRRRVVLAKLGGELPEIPWPALLRWLGPGSVVYLGRLAQQPNVHSSIASPHIALEGGRLEIVPDAIQRGGATYTKHCLQCHGDEGRGASGPSLVQAVASQSDWAFLATVKWGRSGTAMAAQPLDDGAIWNVHAYLRGEAARQQGTQAKEQPRRLAIDVHPDALEFSDRHPDDWLTYAGGYRGHRHSRLTAITKTNVSQLRLAWAAQLRGRTTPLQSSPIVAGGLMFVTESHEGVVALDAKTGERVWQYTRAVPDNLSLCCGSPNRGAAILGGQVFVGTLDAHVVALDAATGKELWIKRVAEHREGYSMTGAPLALRDRVVVGVAGGEFGIRGFIAALRASDGGELWRFYTVPGPGEPGHETWSGDAWQTGGGPTWTVGAYDPTADLVIWGVGNPAPEFNAAVRPGDNLYTNSVIAVSASTGMLRWHYQFTPGDEFDWDAVQQPVLADLAVGATREPLVLWANRNGFFYALNRTSGRFVFAKPFATQTWSAGFDATGRPLRRREAHATRAGSIISPNVFGATNWWPPSYDPARTLVFVPAVDGASVYHSGEPQYERGRLFLGSSSRPAANVPFVFAIRAIDARSGNVRWATTLERGGADVLRRVGGGILSIASGVLFSSHGETFFALDSDNGNRLWSIRLGGPITAPPVTYAIDRRQHVAIAAGSSVFVFALGEAY